MWTIFTMAISCHARGSRGRTLLSFMGVTNVMFVRAENLAFGPEAREKAIDAARAQLAEVIQKEFFEAA